jgi:hypothetical protein
VQPGKFISNVYLRMRRISILTKNAQQNTCGKHRSHNPIRVTHPGHPLAGHTVEVVRSYRRNNEQADWDVSLPDGSRAFLPQDWTETAAIRTSADSQELDAYALLNLAKIVAELQERVRQKGAERGQLSCMDPVPAGKPAVGDSVAGGSQPELLVHICGGSK